MIITTVTAILPLYMVNKIKMHKNRSNKFLEKIEKTIEEKLKLVKEPNQLLESKQDYNDQLLHVRIKREISRK